MYGYLVSPYVLPVRQNTGVAKRRFARDDNSYGELGLGINDKTVSYPRLCTNLKAKKVATGYYYTILIDLDNNVWSTGSNKNGQLGLGSDLHTMILLIEIIGIKAKDVSIGIETTALIDLDNNIWMFGKGKLGQLGIGSDLRATMLMIKVVQC